MNPMADGLQFLTWNETKKSNFFLYTLDPAKGTLRSKVPLLEDKKYDFDKSYSCWLGSQFIVLGTVSPTSPTRRSILLIDLQDGASAAR
jgi:hypothetical protein